MARPCPVAAVQPQPLDLSLPLVLGLFGRADDEPRGAFDRHSSTGFLGAAGPTAVTSVGGRYSLKDNGETPDTQDAIFQYPNFTAAWWHREASDGDETNPPLQFFGPREACRFRGRRWSSLPTRRLIPRGRSRSSATVARKGGRATAGRAARAAAVDRSDRRPHGQQRTNSSNCMCGTSLTA